MILIKFMNRGNQILQGLIKGLDTHLTRVLELDFSKFSNTFGSLASTSSTIDNILSLQMHLGHIHPVCISERSDSAHLNDKVSNLSIKIKFQTFFILK